MTEDSGLDLVGVGKLAKAIPQKAWVQVVDTACTTFKSAIAPLTATTSGIGRLIEAKFDRLVDAEKVLAADIMNRATEKVLKSKRRRSGNAKANIVIAAFEAAASETEPVMRELWANLLAQELTAGKVHPEFPKILARLSSRDAQVLAQVAEREKDKSVQLKRALKQFAKALPFGIGDAFAIADSGEAGSFTQEHLADLRLIRHRAGDWSLTLTGAAFIQSVSGDLQENPDAV